VNRATSPFTPGMTHVSNAIRIENHSVDTRFSLPSGGAIDYGSNAKFWKSANRTLMPSAT
jgi:hypothetical protein